MDTPKAHALFKVAVLRNPRDGEPKVVTYTIDQLIRTVRQAPISNTMFEAYHFQKAEERRLTAEARAAREQGHIERAKDLKAQADTYSLAVDRTKFGLAIVPFIFKDDITSKVDDDNRSRRDNSRITHFSLLMLDAESNTTKEEFHQVLLSPTRSRDCTRISIGASRSSADGSSSGPACMILGRCLRTDQIALPEHDGWRALRFRAQIRAIPLTSSKAGEIPDFADHRHGRHRIDPAQRHERLDCRAHLPVLELCAHRLGEQFDPLVSLAHGAAILGEGDVCAGSVKSIMRPMARPSIWCSGPAKGMPVGGILV
jgi:hypothetical protein